MVDNDIYNSRGKYESFLSHLQDMALTPSERAKAGLKNSGKCKYYCQNPANLQYFRKLAGKFETRDISYIRRLRLFMSLKIIVAATSKDLSQCDRDDLDKIVAFMHKAYNSPKSKSDFIKDIKSLWKDLFPERDEKGRIDETLIPYPVRHLSPKTDKSRERARQDRLTWDEFQSILDYFRDEPNVRAYLALAYDSLARPQELLYLRIRDIEPQQNYAIIHLSEHGKEGTGILQCIDSYKYLTEWLNRHPYSDKPDAFLFLNILTKKGKHDQMMPFTVNKKLRKACKVLKISKPITCYSIKRNGVTFNRLQGLSDMEIQHKARWTSTKQLKTYDMSTQKDGLRATLIRKGIIEGQPQDINIKPLTKVCPVCKAENPIGNVSCSVCNRPISRQTLQKQEQREQLAELNSLLLLEVLKLLGSEQQTSIYQIMKEKGYGEKLQALLGVGATPAS